jgi:hypothetical protein
MKISRTTISISHISHSQKKNPMPWQIAGVPVAASSSPQPRTPKNHDLGPKKPVRLWKFMANWVQKNPPMGPPLQNRLDLWYAPSP